MSVALEPAGSQDVAMPTTERIDRHDNYVYNIPYSDLSCICHFLDKNDVWKQLAIHMGYTVNDCIQFKQLANIDRKSPTEVVISHCGDQNRTITELFMVLYRLQQYSAMEHLRKHVDKRYHRLILKLNQISESKKVFNRPRTSQETIESQTNIDSTESLGVNDLKLTIPLIPYSELQSATNNWSGDVLGKGGFGIVYKGNWKNTQVAIKRIAYQKHDTDEKKKIQIQITQSMNELKCYMCRHDNVVPLYGFSDDGPEPCLVYQYMDGGSLEHRLRKGAINRLTNKPWDSLTFKQRISIAIGIARGLQYMHTFLDKKPLIHGDIKPANILLDSSLVPKIGDFGLVREGSIESMEVSGAYGTRGYVPNEFIRQRTLSVKVDTFSYGVVLFELMTGLRAYDLQRGRDMAFLAIYMWSHFENDHKLQDIRKFIDKTMDIDDGDGFSIFKYSIMMALYCTCQNLSERPDMVFALENLIKLEDFAST